MKPHVLRGGLALLLASTCAGANAQPPEDDYAAMLGYLAQTRIEDRAFSGANGAVSVNMVAGDLNLQSNMRSLASGNQAQAMAMAQQRHSNDTPDLPAQAIATIGDNAFRNASGLVSINQASGSGNTELNSVVVTLAQQGIREASYDFLSSSGPASAEQRQQGIPGTSAPPTNRKVAVESSAFQGFDGVLQLNQIAGSGNASGNHLVVSGSP